MNNWNVYKVFKNGKRAKFPFQTFSADTKDHFFSSVLPKLDKKLQKAEWVVISVDEPQERPEEMRDEKQDKFIQMRNSFLSKIATRDYPSVADKNVVTCLMMNEGTEWKWSWCVAEGATHNFIGCLSDKFNTREEAMNWIENQVGIQPTKSET